MKFYEFLYNKFSNKLQPEISLTFISSGDSAVDKNNSPVTGCDQVKKITNIMRESGNRFVWGIIDYDEKPENLKSEYIKVLGDGKRYAIESYLLDPLLVAALMLRQKLISRSALGLSDQETHESLKNFDNERLQIAANYVIHAVAPNFADMPDDEITCELVNERQISIPNWYLSCQGHTLEAYLLRAFQNLGDIKRNKEEALKLAILNLVVDDMPDLASVDLVKILQSVQV